MKSTLPKPAHCKKNSCLRVKTTDPIEVSALQKLKSCLRDNEIDPIDVSAPQKINYYLEVNKIDYK